MVHVGAPLDNQWAHWPGISYAMPSFAWVGPHHCSVLTGIARAGIDVPIELAGGKVPRGRAIGRPSNCARTVAGASATTADILRSGADGPILGR